MMLPCRHRYVPYADAATGPNIVIDGALNDNASIQLIKLSGCLVIHALGKCLRGRSCRLGIRQRLAQCLELRVHGLEIELGLHLGNRGLHFGQLGERLTYVQTRLLHLGD